MWKVGLVGNFNLDIMIKNVLVAPQFDREILADQYELRIAGTAGYMALVLNSMGVNPVIISTIGKDYYGDFLIDELSKKGITTEGIEPIEGYQTPVGFVITKQNGERAIVSVSGAHDSFSLNNYRENKHQLEECTDIVICGNYLLPNFTVKEAIEVAKEQRALGKRIYFDPSWDPNGWKTETRKDTFELLKHIDVFMMNESEVCHLTKEDNWEEAAKVISLYCNEIIIKLGSKGSAALIHGELIQVSAKGNVSVYDTTGAGDVFDMGYLVASRKNYSTKEALEFASHLAGLVIAQEKGRKYPTTEDVINSLEKDGYNK